MRLPFECAVFLLVALLPDSHALRLRAEGRRRSDDSSLSLQRRTTAVGLVNRGDITYNTNITIGGLDFSALIDTGSSDLWVAGSPNNAKATGETVNINYAIGSVNGPVKIAEVNFGEYTLKEQAYVEVTPDATNLRGSGLVGLGPNTGSLIWDKLKPDPAGTTLLDSIFALNTSTPNYMTVLLGRTEDPTDVFPGDFTVGEVIPEYSDVVNQPKLEVTDVPVRQQGDQHFQILVDKDGILGPDGKPIQVKTRVDSTKDDYQPTAIVDTGFSLTQVPKKVADAMYSRFTGAEYVNVSGVGATWIVPCDIEVNMTFTFGGVQIPIHPLDATLNPDLLGLENIVNNEGQECCLGTFQPISFKKDTFDMILGMSFLRNVYTLIDYGDFVAENAENKGDPYIQFLSTTEKVEAHNDFVRVRLNGVDTTNQITLSPLQQTDDDPEEASTSNRPSWFWYIIIGSAIAGGLFLLLFAFLFFRRRSSSKARGAYAKLHNPNGPHGQQVNMHTLPNMGYNEPYNPQAHRMSGTNSYNYQHARGTSYSDNAPPYDPHSQASYNNPWDHRY